MPEKSIKTNNIIEIKNGVVAPKSPLLKILENKRPGDYPGLSKAYIGAAQVYSSPLLAGPPICDELMALIQHMFTEDEAEIVRRIKPLTRKTAAWIARSARISEDEVKPVLDRLAREKCILLATGNGRGRKYSVMPILPGTFEAVMIVSSWDDLTDWQKEFARLFEDLYGTGYITDYLKHDTPMVRYLPVEQSIQAHPMALPSDSLEEIFDRYNTFAVGLCQCRMTEELAGRGCGRTLENCVSFGEPLKAASNAGKLRLISREEALDIKRQAEAEGLVNWMINEESGKWVGCSCSCCGCCCHMMKTVTDYDMPAMIAPPHFLPRFDYSACNYCTKCALACPMGAITVDAKGKNHIHNVKRCIGCGQCLVACDKQKAVTMEAVPGYAEPPSSYASLAAKLAPNVLRTAYSAWRSRK